MVDQTKTVAQPVAAPRVRAPRISVARLPEPFRTVLQNRKATIGVSILLVFLLVAVFAPQLSGTTRPERMVAKSHLQPGAVQNNKTYILGTTRQGQDMFAQIVYGARTTLIIGFLTGTVIVIIGIAIGITAGYVGGWADEVLSLITNVFLILPGLPLIIVVAAWIKQSGPMTVVLVLSLTSWAYGARVFRAQSLALRNSEFVAAAKVAGESNFRIIFYEILPNMVSLVVSSFIGAVLYAILAEAGLEFIGLGDPNQVTWGTILYWAQQNQALLVGAWWTFIPPGVCIALIGLALTLINYGIDEITNPRLKTEKG